MRVNIIKIKKTIVLGTVLLQLLISGCTVENKPAFEAKTIEKLENKVKSPEEELIEKLSLLKDKLNENAELSLTIEDMSLAYATLNNVSLPELNEMLKIYDDNLASQFFGAYEKDKKLKDEEIKGFSDSIIKYFKDKTLNNDENIIDISDIFSNPKDIKEIRSFLETVNIAIKNNDPYILKSAESELLKSDASYSIKFMVVIIDDGVLGVLQKNLEDPTSVDLNCEEWDIFYEARDNLNEFIDYLKIEIEE